MAVDCIDSSDYVSKILSDRRKAKKPMMEKLRRARINDSLNELKVLVLELLNKDASRYSKMEKADILEMTVGYLRAAQRIEKRTQGSTPPSDFRAGFNACAVEVSNRLSPADANTDNLRETLLSHLVTGCHGNTTPQSQTLVAPSFSSGTMWVPYPSPPPSPINQSSSFVNAALREVSRPLSPVSPCSRSPAQTTIVSTTRKTTERRTALWRPW
ncbi:predicted protein [Nematostella vectensis]|uniref:Hes3 n=1 Tax=Nematostella vectensis TaxID=45351 RepID=A7RYX4_NEMVE|nr:transcription factor HES-1-A [Nematostella vectensis]AEW42995.1 Hes3 [Nematostella vectensis]EDO43263.1 predicted protein [Nematostella vectensis]|eukprot:XP_001635326.1 predicted protein [Nematostella vectensis]